MIENIILDLGNVILPLRINRCRINFAMFGVLSINSNYTSALHLLEEGKISEDEFLTILNKAMLWGGKPQAKASWNSILGRIPKEYILKLESLRANYNLYLLSNINVIHEKEIIRQMGEENYIRFSESFQKIYFSHHIGYRKPNKQAWQIIIDENNLDVSRTLFVDDLFVNTSSASALGLKVHTLSKVKDFAKLETIIANELYH